MQNKFLQPGKISLSKDYLGKTWLLCIPLCVNLIWSYFGIHMDQFSIFLFIVSSLRKPPMLKINQNYPWTNSLQQRCNTSYICQVEHLLSWTMKCLLDYLLHHPLVMRHLFIIYLTSFAYRIRKHSYINH